MKDYVTLRQRKRKNCTSLYLDIYYKGKRKCESLNLYLVEENTREDKRRNKETLAQAEAIRAEKLTEINNKVFQFKTDDISLYNLIQQIIDDRQLKKSQYNWQSAFIYIKKYSKDIMVSQIDKQWCEGFYNFLHNYDLQKGAQTIKMANNTVRSYFCKMKTILNIAVKKGYLVVSPCNISAPKIKQSERCFLTIDEVFKMNNTPCSDYIKRPFMFSCLTGLRYSDIKKMKWKEVSVFEGMTRITFEQQKTRALEYLDINQQAAELLGERQGDDDLVFQYVANPTAINNGVREWALRAGIDKHITFHSGRHTFATMMLTLGTDIYTVSKLLGHAQVMTTQIYAKIIDSKKRDAVNNIPNMK